MGISQGIRGTAQWVDTRLEQEELAEIEAEAATPRYVGKCEQQESCRKCTQPEAYLGHCERHDPEFGQHYCAMFGLHSTEFTEATRHQRPLQQASLAAKIRALNWNT